MLFEEVSSSCSFYIFVKISYRSSVVKISSKSIFGADFSPKGGKMGREQGEKDTEKGSYFQAGEKCIRLLSNLS